MNATNIVFNVTGEYVKVKDTDKFEVMSESTAVLRYPNLRESQHEKYVDCLIPGTSEGKYNIVTYQHLNVGCKYQECALHL